MKPEEKQLLQKLWPLGTTSLLVYLLKTSSALVRRQGAEPPQELADAIEAAEQLHEFLVTFGKALGQSPAGDYEKMCGAAERDAARKLYHAARLVQILHEKPLECKLPAEFKVKLDPMAKKQLDEAIIATEQAFENIEGTVNGTALRSPRPGLPRNYRVHCAAGPLAGLHAPCYDAYVTATSEQEAAQIGGEGAYQVFSVKEHSLIPARTWSDDHAFEIDFDAAFWFEQASDEDIIALAQCGWGGDYPSDAVVHWETEHRDLTGDLVKMFDYIGRVHGRIKDCGFECRVDEDAAKAWLEKNRPGIDLEKELE